MSNSPLVRYTKLSPNNSGQRTHTIDRITPHCTAFHCNVETLGNVFATYHPKNGTSANYGIGDNGKVGMYVPENERAWTSSSRENDQRAITIECSSDDKYPQYAMNENVYNTLVALCIDICWRYGKKKLLWFNDKEKTLAYDPKPGEMVLTVHRWFSDARSCPGDWLYSRLGELAATVTNALNPTNTIYRVQIGAFRKKEYAELYAEKARKAGFKDAFIVTAKK